MTSLVLTAQAQVEVKQTMTNTNCDGLPSVCDQSVKINGLTVTNDHGHITIQYKGHTYKLYDNGTITEVK